VLNNFKKRFDHRRYNGAILLGLKGISVKSHGSADVLAFGNAISAPSMRPKTAWSSAFLADRRDDAGPRYRCGERLIMYARLIGTGSYLPGNPVSNDDLAARGIDTNDEWIVTRTGIRSRYLAEPGTTSSELGLIAAQRALEMAGVRLQTST
jgi:hypothetical protein